MKKGSAYFLSSLIPHPFFGKITVNVRPCHSRERPDVGFEAMIRSTWIWLLTAAALAVAALFYCSRPSPPSLSGGKESGNPTPNVVLISIDTLRSDHVGGLTPNIKAFAHESIDCRNAWSQSTSAVIASTIGTARGNTQGS